MIFAFNLFEPYEFQFFRNGLIVATIAGALCGLLGVFVILRGMSYIGHGLSHAVFGGAAASAVMKINYFFGRRHLGCGVRFVDCQSRSTTRDRCRCRNRRCHDCFVRARTGVDETLWPSIKEH